MVKQSEWCIVDIDYSEANFNAENYLMASILSKKSTETVQETGRPISMIPLQFYWLNYQVFQSHQKLDRHFSNGCMRTIMKGHVSQQQWNRNGIKKWWRSSPLPESAMQTFEAQSHVICSRSCRKKNRRNGWRQRRVMQCWRKRSMNRIMNLMFFGSRNPNLIVPRP